MCITLATWNIHACIGADRRFEPQRVARVLQEIDADVTALQEMEHHLVDGMDLLDYLAARAGLSAIAGPTLRRESRHFGNALLTRLPVLTVERIDLSLPRREPRGAIEVTLDCRGRRMQVVATHLGLKPGERRRQVRRLLALFENGSADIRVLLGDLNEWLLWGRPLRWLRRHFSPTPHPNTYPARFPLLALDRIWVRPDADLLGIDIHDSPAARIASDHLPLKARLACERPGAA
jgi:endonuclease/exonuclease/phosphatase family metal-dependent hydrolase